MRMNRTNLTVVQSAELKNIKPLDCVLFLAGTYFGGSPKSEIIVNIWRVFDLAVAEELNLEITAKNSI